MDHEEKPKTKVAQLFASFSLFLIGRQTFADLLILFHNKGHPEVTGAEEMTRIYRHVLKNKSFVKSPLDF